MSSSLLLMEPMGGSFGRFLPSCRAASASERSCGPSLARIEFDIVIFCGVVFLLKNEWSPSFPHEELEAWACVAHVASRCTLLGYLPLSQDILTLVPALNLPPSLSNAGEGRPRC
ncbi:hypothetical protein CK203_111388 [Vitis vinifera]|uniref:Uncharacterized protein n=1 Tax=Vitis vinifera TaxID=29760 RepID=A0A438FF10_VITVI|nr:hypothetical protein CK203_111388 [Vitis vinifera]